MPGPRRTLAAVLCAAVVGLFLVSGAAMAQASSPHRVTVGSTASGQQHVSLSKTASAHDHALHQDLLAVLPEPVTVAAAAPLRTEAAVVEGLVAGHATRAVVRGPPEA